MKIREPKGTGPGARTSDGCSVELYKGSPYRGELDALEAYLSDRSVLELGCGAGRLTRRLMAMNSRVLAVDSSFEMLACLPEGVAAKQAEIGELSLREVFDVVLLASYLYNTPLAATRRRFGEVLRSHSLGGCLLLQVHGERLLELDQGYRSFEDGFNSNIEYFRKEGNLVDMTIRYSKENLSWTHSFQAEVLAFNAIQEELLMVGFTSVQWVDESRGWLCAR